MSNFDMKAHGDNVFVVCCIYKVSQWSIVRPCWGLPGRCHCGALPGRCHCGALPGRCHCGALPGRCHCGSLSGRCHCGSLPWRCRCHCGALPGRCHCGSAQRSCHCPPHFQVLEGDLSKTFEFYSKASHDSKTLDKAQQAVSSACKVGFWRAAAAGAQGRHSIS